MSQRLTAEELERKALRSGFRSATALLLVAPWGAVAVWLGVFVYPNVYASVTATELSGAQFWRMLFAAARSGVVDVPDVLFYLFVFAHAVSVPLWSLGFRYFVSRDTLAIRPSSTTSESSSGGGLTSGGSSSPLGTGTDGDDNGGNAQAGFPGPPAAPPLLTALDNLGCGWLWWVFLGILLITLSVPAFLLWANAGKTVAAVHAAVLLSSIGFGLALWPYLRSAFQGAGGRIAYVLFFAGGTNTAAEYVMKAMDMP